MKLPEYTDDIGWNDIIYRYLHNDQELKARQDIEYHMWNYFKDCLKEVIDIFSKIQYYHFLN